ncbi:MAG: hypothetical protein ACREOF_16975 [Gemmatimonadales bacterium]
MGRAVIALVAGALAAGLIVGGVEAAGARLVPEPPGIFAAVLAGWLLAAATGAWIAARVGGAGRWWLGLAVGGLILAAAAYNLSSFPHPIWMTIAGLVGIPAAAWLGASNGRRGIPARTGLQRRNRPADRRVSLPR